MAGQARLRGLQAGLDSQNAAEHNRALPDFLGRVVDRLGQYAKRVAENAPYLALLNQIQDAVRETPQQTAALVHRQMSKGTKTLTAPKGKAGRPRTNDHFLTYFAEARKTFSREQKNDQQIFLDYRREHSDQRICRNKATKQYFDACRAALNEARKPKPKK